MIQDYAKASMYGSRNFRLINETLHYSSHFEVGQKELLNKAMKK